jgi:cytochrome c peroxidase
VIVHYDSLNLDRLHADGELILRPLQLTTGQRADLLAFLQTLSDPAARRWRAPPAPPCGKV